MIYFTCSRTKFLGKNELTYLSYKKTKQIKNKRSIKSRPSLYAKRVTLPSISIRKLIQNKYLIAVAQRHTPTPTRFRDGPCFRQKRGSVTVTATDCSDFT
jgi:hypothetical protein